jgi:hypothetical protein
MFIHVSHANVPDSILVNAALLVCVPRLVQFRRLTFCFCAILQESSASVPPGDISPVFGIVLQQRGEPIVNVLLGKERESKLVVCQPLRISLLLFSTEAPDDPQQLEVYNRLQKVVVTSMKDAEDAMNKRIEQFVDAQREQLQEFTTRAFQDKKLFWLRYVAAIKGQCVPTAGPPLPPSSSPATVDPTSASASDSGSSSPATSSPASTSFDAYNAAMQRGVAKAAVVAAAPAPVNLRSSTDPTDGVSANVAPPLATSPLAPLATVSSPTVVRKPRRVSGLSGQSRAVFDIEIGAPGVDDEVDVDSDAEDESADDSADDASSDAAALAAQSKATRVQRPRANANAASRSPKTRAATGVAMSLPLAIPDFGGRQSHFGGRRGLGGTSHTDVNSDDDDANAIDETDFATMARTFQTPLDGIDDGFDRPSFRDRAEYIQRTRKFTK